MPPPDDILSSRFYIDGGMAVTEVAAAASAERCQGCSSCSRLDRRGGVVLISPFLSCCAVAKVV